MHRQAAVELAGAAPTTSLAPPRRGDGRDRATDTAVSARLLTKRYSPRATVRDMVLFAGRAPTVAVVDRVSVDVYSGEVFGLLGPNGAGKTTIFKVLSTMIAPDAGTARVAGFDVVRQAGDVRRVLASVPADERSLNWRLSARENLVLFAALQRVARTDTGPRVAWALQTVALADTGAKRVAEFSSGMRQRLLIARALLTRPKILLLDEPTRNLDPLSARELRQFLRDELVARYGCTILLATHNTDEAFTFCDRVAVLDRGRVLATGATNALSAQFGEARYRVLTREPSHPAFPLLEQRGLLRRVSALERSPDGWTSLECCIAGGLSHSAAVLRLLVGHGVEVARLERVEPSLADLITRIIAAEGGPVPNA